MNSPLALVGHCNAPPAVRSMTIAALIAVAIGFTASPVHAAVVTLYDGMGVPGDQAWLLYGFDNIGANQSDAMPGTQLQTTTAVRAGYSNYRPIMNTLKNAAFPNLVRSNGFELSFSAQLNSESHVSNDRAGFSLILLGADNKGVELGFWNNEIWVQTDVPPFTHGTGVSIDTTQPRDYRLRIEGDDYLLLEGNSTLLSGMVQDYSGALAVPYALPNYLFLGDNTTSAGADVVLGPITLQSNLTAVPEAGSSLLCMMSLAALQARRRRIKTKSPRAAP